jgi:hypothetical protein
MNGGFVKATAIAILALVAADRVHGQAPAPSEIVTQLDTYFENPDEPETFRALTGIGDPQIVAEDAAEADAQFYPRVAGADISRLFPGPDERLFLPSPCRVDYALETLRARTAKFGAEHPYVRQWIAAQRATFSMCSHGASGAPTELPPPIATRDPAIATLQEQDRAYQAASILFYRDDRPAALEAFRRIAADTASPHRSMARYMVAAIRAGSVASGWVSRPLVPADQSIAEVKAIMADPGLAPIHAIAQELLGWIGATVADDGAREAQVRATMDALERPAAELARDPQAARRYALARADIDRLHRWSPSRDPAWWLGGGPPREFAASRALMDLAPNDPMAAWVLFPASYVQGHAWSPFQSYPYGWRALFDYAAEKAKGAGPLAFAWSRVKLSIDSEYDPDFWAEIGAEQTRALAGDEPATAALAFDFYHQVRLALSAWRSSGAADPAAFDAALSAMRSFPLKDADLYRTVRRDGLQYLMSVWRLEDARHWRDELCFQPGASPDPTLCDATLLAILAEDEAHLAAVLARGAQGVEPPLLNALSIQALRRLAAHTEIAGDERALFARVAWARTYALGRPVDGALDRLMRGLNPALAQRWSSRPGRTVEPGDRRALLDVLRTPGLNILIVDADREAGPSSADTSDPGVLGIDLYNHDDDNWWCAWKTGRNTSDMEAILERAFYGSADLSLVDGNEAYDLRGRLRRVLAASYAIRSQDPEETRALTAIDCAPKMLTQRVLDWVDHPRLFERRFGQAEALALAVRMTRYGCYSDGPLGVYSKAAWTTLHRRFPDSDWSKQTKYWFNCPLGGTSCPATKDD